MDIKKDDHGFTFINVFWTMMIITMIIPFLSFVLKASDIPDYSEEISIRQFFQFIRDDLAKAKNVRTDGSTLSLEEYSGKETTIAQYEHLVRRQVDGKGHEVYLRDIQNIHFSPINRGMLVSITSMKGERYEKKIAFYPS